MRRVDDVLVHLVGDNIDIILFGKARNQLQLVPGEHLAAGVRGVAQDQRLGTLGKALFDQADVKLIGGRHQRDIDGFRARKNGIGTVVLVER